MSDVGANGMNVKGVGESAAGGAMMTKHLQDGTTPFDVQADDDHNEDLFDTSVSANTVHCSHSASDYTDKHPHCSLLTLIHAATCIA